MDPKALEKVLEELLENYSFFKDNLKSLLKIKTMNSTSVITIVRDRNKPIHQSYIPFGIQSREILKGKIQIMDHLLEALDPFSSDFVKIRYYEMQSRDFVIRYLKIGSISTYKRIRHRVLKKCLQTMAQLESLDVYFPELKTIFTKGFHFEDHLSDEQGNPVSEE